MGGKSRNPEIWVIRRSVIKVVPGYCFQTKFSGTKGCILASLWPPTESYFTNLDIPEIFGVPFPVQKAVSFGAFRSCRVRSTSEFDQKSKPPALLVELQLEMWKESFIVEIEK